MRQIGFKKSLILCWNLHKDDKAVCFEVKRCCFILPDGWRAACHLHVINDTLLHWISEVSVASVVYHQISVRSRWRVASLPIAVNDEDLPLHVFWTNPTIHKLVLHKDSKYVKILACYVFIISIICKGFFSKRAVQTTHFHIGLQSPGSSSLIGSRRCWIMGVNVSSV